MPEAVDLKCPRCNSRRLVHGELSYGRTIGGPEQIHFRAFAARYPSLRQGVAVSKSVLTCAMCGLFWGEVQPTQLEAHLSRFAPEATKAWLRDNLDAPL